MLRSPSAFARLLAGVVVAALAGAPDPAAAAEIPFAGSLAVQIAAADPIVVEGAGIAVVNGSDPEGPLDSLEIPAGAFAIADLELSIVGFEPIRSVLGELANQAGSFARSGDDFGGPMGVDGAVLLCFFAECETAELPLGPIGIGGSETVESDPAAITVTSAPWTIGEVEVDGFSLAGFAIGADGDPERVLAPGGALRLVTPIAIDFDIGLESVPAFGVLTVEFVPQPDAGALAAASAAALALLARARRRP